MPLFPIFGGAKISSADIAKVKNNKILKAVSGSIAFDITTPFKVSLGTIPAGAIIVKTDVNIATAFNAGTTNVLVVGHGASFNEQVAAGDVDETSATLQTKATALAALSAAKEVFVKYTQTGGAATTGAADVTVYYLQ